MDRSITDSSRPHDLEERLNSITHSIGAGMSIGGLVFLLVLTSLAGGGALKYIAFSVYGAFQISLYLSSAVTHQFTDKPRVYRIARIFDQVTIYYLIAGTYTPVALLIMPEPWRWWMLLLAWVCAFLGTILKGFIFQEQHHATDLLYLLMGWLIVIFIGPLLQHAPEGFMFWMISGAFFYTVGIIFYLTHKIPLSHVVWHLFVIAGGLSFYLGFALHLI